MAAGAIQTSPIPARNVQSRVWARSVLLRRPERRGVEKAAGECRSRPVNYTRWDAAGLWVIPDSK